MGNSASTTDVPRIGFVVNYRLCCKGWVLLSRDGCGAEQEAQEAQKGAGLRLEEHLDCVVLRDWSSDMNGIGL